MDDPLAVDPAHDGDQNNILGDSNSNSTVVFAQVAFRNGLHAVETGDPYNVSYHEEDVTDLRLMADLTKRGKIQEYMIGKYLKERYANLFNNSYNQYKIRMNSGYKNRSLTSAALVLAGMFPPEQDYEIWNEDLRWQPIPVHINRKITDTDSMNIALLGACSSLDFVSESEGFKKLVEHYEWIIGFLCGQLHKKPTPVNAMSISSALVNLAEYPGSQPDWANATVMEEAKNYYWDIHAVVNSYMAVVRLSAGYILEDIVNEMKYYMARASHRKFVGYSLHVDNQNSLLFSLNNETVPKLWPPMGGFMSVELHYLEGQYIVKAYYWYESYTEPIEVSILGCDSPCTLEKFEERSRDYKVDDWGVECGQVTLSTTASAGTQNSGETVGVVQSAQNSQQGSTLSKSSSAVNGWLLAVCIIFGVLFLATLAVLLRVKRRLKAKGEYMEIR